MSSVESRLDDTRRAFDSVAADYDGPTGNNALIQRMRARMWRALTATFPAGSRLLDLGCGTGIDAVYLASRGYSVLATDWSPAMVARTRERIAAAGLEICATAELLGVQELSQLPDQRFDGMYSNLGSFNCVPDLRAAARSCAALLEPKGRIVASVIGRICPWEVVYYAARGDWKRALLRRTHASVPVPLNRQTVWTRYYTPREFYRAFAAEFDLASYQGLSIFLPPPYLIRISERFSRLCSLEAWLDDHLGALPVVRNAGDHFMMVMAKRD